MRTRALLVCVVLAAGSFGVATPLGSVTDGQAPAKTAPAKTPAQAPAPAKPTAETLDQLLAPIALYPDALLSQVLLCAANPGKLGALSEWLQSQPTLKGSELQDAAKAAGFEASFLALVVFPDVVDYMAGQMEWTVRLGQAFTADQSAVFASIQRLRTKARDAGKLKSTPQQDVETRTTSSGQQVIVIEPSNPQVVYVPQYNSSTVYTTSSTVVVEQSSSADAVAAGVIGFTAGIAIGAAFDNDYYYGPYGMHGGFYMYDDAWDDWYDHREDAREDWMDHREDLYEERGDRREDLADERSERAGTAQEQRSERAQTRQENRPEAQAQREQRRAEAQASGARQTSAGAASQESRGYSREQSAASRERSGSGSSAFSGYSSGRSERAASQRGQRSRGSSGGRRR
jgi:hypothetical protein